MSNYEMSVYMVVCVFMYVCCVCVCVCVWFVLPSGGIAKINL